MAHLVYTTVIHNARIELGLSMNEYAVADLIYKLSNNPANQQKGWCYASREKMAQLLGLTKQTIVSIITSLTQKGIIEKDEETKFLRATPLWFNTVEYYIPIGKETLPSVKNSYGAVKNSYEIGKESLPNNNIYINNNNNKTSREKPTKKRNVDYTQPQYSPEYLDNVPPTDIAEWQQRFKLHPEKLKREVYLAREWVKDNPGRTKNYKQFLRNWLNRAADNLSKTQQAQYVQQRSVFDDAPTINASNIEQLRKEGKIW